MVVVSVKCEPEHARTLARRAAALGQFEIAAALEILAGDVEGYRRALTEHHAIHNLPEAMRADAWGNECPICKAARERRPLHGESASEERGD